MTRDTLITYGKLLYGEHWRAQLAKRLRIERSTVSRWASGAVNVPPMAQETVELLVESKQLGGTKWKQHVG
jgi:transcriptional regulator with XRE-family HTH domain